MKTGKCKVCKKQGEIVFMDFCKECYNKQMKQIKELEKK